MRETIGLAAGCRWLTMRCDFVSGSGGGMRMRFPRQNGTGFNSCCQEGEWPFSGFRRIPLRIADRLATDGDIIGAHGCKFYTAGKQTAGLNWLFPLDYDAGRDGDGKLLASFGPEICEHFRPFICHKFGPAKGRESDIERRKTL